VETEPAVIEKPPVSVPEPNTPPVVIAKPTIEPAAPVIVEPKVSAPPTPVNSAPVPEKIIAAPAKPAKHVAEKPYDKATSNNAVAAENTAPALSMEDLALQIAQVGEKYGNQQPVPNETTEKKQPTTQNHNLLVRQYSADARHKVERIGNLNYPKSAWQKEFTEKSVIEAVISADGGLQSIRIKKSSGDSAIDEAARNIVQTSAPFAAFPQKLAAELDSIKVTFPLRFSDESGITVH
jgi:protein TonB